jgi:hypothetical protein
MISLIVIIKIENKMTPSAAWAPQYTADTRFQYRMGGIEMAADTRRPDSEHCRPCVHF